MVRLLFELRIELDLWKAQNILYALAQTLHRAKRDAADQAGPQADAAKRWLGGFYALGELMKVKVG
jgi:hypothetical protein